MVTESGGSFASVIADVAARAEKLLVEEFSDRGFDVGEDIPFRETRHYVNNVLEAQSIYEELYGRNLYRDSE